MERRRFDLCLVDIKLPHIDGLDFIEAAQPLLKETGVVVFTGYGSLEETVRALELGVRGFVTKPIPPERLLQAVQVALARQELTTETYRRSAFKTLLKLSELASKEESPGGILDAFLTGVMAYTGATRGALFLSLKSGMYLARSEGFPQPLDPPSAPKLWKALAKREVLPLAEEGYLSWPTLEPRSDEDPTALCIPLRVKGKVYGLVLLEHTHSGEVFSCSDVQFIWIASTLAASALEGLGEDLADYPVGRSSNVTLGSRRTYG